MSFFIALLCFICPPLSVGLQRGFGHDFSMNVLWTLLGWFPGIIHAYIVNTKHLPMT